MIDREAFANSLLANIKQRRAGQSLPPSEKAQGEPPPAPAKPKPVKKPASCDLERRMRAAAKQLQALRNES